MIEALILGQLTTRPEMRTARTSGREFAVVKVRTATNGGESVMVNAIAFSESAAAALLALDAGDSVALGGTLKAGAWTDRDGNARPSVDIVVATVMTAYGLKKKRAAVSKAQGGALDDEALPESEL
jgi:single-stranded DNA-binding protein